MAENRDRAAWRVDTPLTAKETKQWKKAESEYVARMRSEAARRDLDTDAPTESDLNDIQSVLEQFRGAKTMPDQCKGDISSAAPAIVVDADDGEKFVEEVQLQMKAAAPRNLVMASDSDMQLVFPFACISIVAENVHTVNIVTAADRALSARVLSETPHDSLDGFVADLRCLEFSRQEHDKFLFGVYAGYGVTCQFGGNWVLRRYMFTRSSS